MTTVYSPGLLRKIRNDIQIEFVISYLLKLNCHHDGGYLRFPCPFCHGYHTAVKPETNLARCFDCKINLNPIDMFIAVKKWDFRKSVDYLKRWVK